LAGGTIVAAYAPTALNFPVMILEFAELIPAGGDTV
jgi:hypothetical protein